MKRRREGVGEETDEGRGWGETNEGRGWGETEEVRGRG